MLASMFWLNPLSDMEVRRIRTAERAQEHSREVQGLPRYMADRPAISHYGPLRPFYDVQGARIGETSDLHSFGPHKRKYQRAEVETGEDSDELEHS